MLYIGVSDCQSVLKISLALSLKIWLALIGPYE